MIGDQEHERWASRLSEYVDEGLAAPERDAVARHVDSCERCADAVRELAQVRERARTLEPRAPERDLWPGIAAAIRRREAPDVIPLDAAVERDRWRLSLSLPQLVAASVALVLGAGGAAWFAKPTAEPASVPVADVTAPEVVRVAEGPVDSGDASPWSEDLARLEEALAQRRGRLDPNTVRILEKNLAVIDGAIRESLQALEVDPGNAYLEQHLERAYERKSEYLREAVALVALAD